MRYSWCKQAIHGPPNRLPIDSQTPSTDESRNKSIRHVADQRARYKTWPLGYSSFYELHVSIGESADSSYRNTGPASVGLYFGLLRRLSSSPPGSGSGRSRM